MTVSIATSHALSEDGMSTESAPLAAGVATARYLKKTLSGKTPLIISPAISFVLLKLSSSDAQSR